MKHSYGLCPICQRLMDDDSYQDEHHWIPKCKKGIETALMHRICHSKIHDVFTENMLRDYYHTAERILEHEEMQNFVHWLRNKPHTFHISSARRKKR